MGQWIKFTTVENLNHRKDAKIMSRLNSVIKLYKNQSFTIKTMFTDNDFEVHDSALNQNISYLIPLPPKDEHVPEIKRKIQVIKERLRAIKNTLP